MKQATRDSDAARSGQKGRDRGQATARGDAGPSAARLSLKRLLPLLVLLGGTVLFFAAGLDRYVSFEMLREHRETLLAWVEADIIATAAAFALIYAAAVAFSLPGAGLLSITAGFLFGAWLGTILSVTAATAGATVIFAVAKTALGEPLRARAGPALKRVEDGFRENAFSYLLFLRLVPIFPFFVVNLAPAFMGVSLRTFVLATFIGIIPGGFVYVSVGAGLGSIFDEGGELSLESVITPQIMIALTGLAVLALIPPVVKAIRARRGKRSS